MTRLPYIITDNLNEKYVNAVFELLKLIKDSRIKDKIMTKFMTTLCDYDGRTDDLNDKWIGIQSLNDAYSKMSVLQQKIVNKTFEDAFMNYDIDRIKKKYLWEIEKLLSNKVKKGSLDF